MTARAGIAKAGRAATATPAHRANRPAPGPKGGLMPARRDAPKVGQTASRAMKKRRGARPPRPERAPYGDRPATPGPKPRHKEADGERGRPRTDGPAKSGGKPDWKARSDDQPARDRPASRDTKPAARAKPAGFDPSNPSARMDSGKARKPARTFGAKPGAKPGGKPGGKPGFKAGGKPAGKPFGKPGAKTPGGDKRPTRPKG